MSTPLGKQAIEALLSDLSDELERRGAQADLFLVGGAAIALAYDARRSTRDLDAAFAPTEVVRTAARAVADQHGLEPDWLNDAVKDSSRERIPTPSGISNPRPYEWMWLPRSTCSP